MTVLVINGQSLFDIAVQEFGSVLSVFEIAFANNLSVTDELKGGQVLTLPDSAFTNNDIANYFKGNKRNIATGLTIEHDGIVAPRRGIGYMQIGTSFIVS